MKQITKLQDNISSLNASDLNKGLYDLEDRTNYLESLINEQVKNKQANFITNCKINTSVTGSRIVYFIDNEWKTIDSLTPAGELLEFYPVGMTSSVFTNNYGTVYFNGKVDNVSSDIVDTGIVEIGVPYYLTQNGKISTFQPSVGIYIGVFLTTTSFVLNIQIMTNSHIHRRSLLDSSKWEDHTTYLLYPIAELGEIPLPFRGMFLVIDSRYCPEYGPYKVDIDGIKITDLVYFTALLGGNPFTFLTTHNTEAFWSFPHTLTTPGVMTLESGTNNLTIENKIPGQPAEVGSLIIKNIPEIETVVDGTVISDIETDATGKLLLTKQNVVEKLTAGENITLSAEQGEIVINANNSRKIEVEASDVFLQGALSKIVPNTVITYVEFPYTRITGAIYKFYLPYNFDEAKDLTISVKACCVGYGVFSESLNIYYSNSTYFDTLPSSTVVSVVIDGSRISDNYILTLQNMKKSLPLYLKIERPISINEFAIGIISVTAQYFII